MTDDEIITALECCVKNDIEECGKCVLNMKSYCVLALSTNAFNLINRQKAEIKRLKAEIEEANVAEREAENQSLNENKENAKIFLQAIEHAKSEAIKEFAERLKMYIIKPEYPWEDFYVTEESIDNIVKEMMEVQNNDR